MGAVIDTRQSYLDESGEIISAGRLVVYKFGTTEYADIFQDQELSLPIANPLGLSSASWTSTQVYAGESLTVLVQKYEGLDEFGQPIFSTVKTFDSIASASVSWGSSGSITVVDTVEDLRNITGMQDTQIAMVKGYITPTDCYVRKYIWSDLSMAIDNGGTVISSLTSPTGRWILQFEGNTLDIRAFGVLPGATDVNSQFRAACNWASPAKVTLIIPTGTYYLTSSGTFDCYAALDVAEGVKLNRGITSNPNSATWYYLNLYNPHTLIRTTFAGVNCFLSINGSGWEHTRIPVTAFDTTLKGYSVGSGAFILYANAAVSFTSSCVLSAVEVPTAGAPVTVSAGATVSVVEIFGLGSIAYQTSQTMHVMRLRSSQVSAFTGNAIARAQRVVLDSAVTLPTGLTIGGVLEVNGGSLTFSSGCAVTGAVIASGAFVSGSVGANFGTNGVDGNWFSSGDALINSFNASTSGPNILDMAGRSSSVALTRNGATVKNGTIASVSASSCVLDRVVCTGVVDVVSLTATGCALGNAGANCFPRLGAAIIRDCSLATLQAAPIPLNGEWERVTASNCDCRNVGGNVTIRGLICRHVTFAPYNSALFNVNWDGGDLSGGIYFDSTLNNVSGFSTMGRVNINHVSGLPLNIVTLTAGDKYWVSAGAIDISENAAGTRATRGSARMTSTVSSSTVSALYMGDVVFALGGDTFDSLELCTNVPSTSMRYPILFTPANVTGQQGWRMAGKTILFYAYAMKGDMSTFINQGMALPLSVSWRIYA